MNASDVRKAHKLLDYVSQGRAVLDDEIKLLRGFLPELPKQKTLEGVATDVYIAWNETYGSDWEEDTFGDLEVWLGELYEHLRSLADAEPAKPAHPEFLETEGDYENAPEGTVVARDSLNPWVKEEGVWMQGTTADATVYRVPCLKGTRRVLRWGGK